jgi:ribosomal protein S17
MYSIKCANDGVVTDESGRKKTVVATQRNYLKHLYQKASSKYSKNKRNTHPNLKIRVKGK